MANLMRANEELFRRPPDERFDNLGDLAAHCQDLRQRSRRLKEPGPQFGPVVHEGELALRVNSHSPAGLNDWSFGQLCAIGGVAKDTLNRLRPATASQVLQETLDQRTREDTELQALLLDDQLVRAVNGEHYKRLWNAEVAAVLQEFAVDFTPPQQGSNGATGLYAGQQDMFCFLIDPTGWAEIGGEHFAPGFFVWNSEVGKRTVGLSTFWFQAVCANHIVWDAVEVTEFTRKHTGRVRDALGAIRAGIERLVEKRDARKDGFAKVISKAMETRYADDAEEAVRFLNNSGFAKTLAARAVEVARRDGALTLWSVVDALTQLAREAKYAGARTESEQRACSLLGLVAG